MKHLWLIMITAVMACISPATPVLADDDDDGYGYEHEREYEHERHEGGSHSHGIVVHNALYKTECGACHLAYQPGLLPASSWRRIMATLDRHFGENAELPADKRNSLQEYLVANAAAGGSSIGEAPLRISETPHFRREHRELSDRLVKGNPKVRSFANCQACHGGADNGDFSEHRINIPGYGRWED